MQKNVTLVICYLCLGLSQEILKSIVQSGHVYFETEIEQY